MAANNFEVCLQHVLKHEGGFVNDPRDPGEATKFGVTRKVWEQWVGHKVSVPDIVKLTVEDVTPLYKERYWDVCKCDELRSGLDYVIFDIAVNSGSSRAAKFIQSTMDIPADGVVGPITLSAINNSPLSTEELINIICDKRQKFWENLKNKETGELMFPIFGKGWTRRGNEVRETALTMVS